MPLKKESNQIADFFFFLKIREYAGTNSWDHKEDTLLGTKAPLL